MVENVRVGRRVFQRQALYLGELNDSQREEWRRAVEALDEKGNVRQLKLFPEDRAPETDDGQVALVLTRSAARSLKETSMRAKRMRSAMKKLFKLDDRIEAHIFTAFCRAKAGSGDPAGPARTDVARPAPAEDFKRISLNGRLHRSSARSTAIAAAAT